MHKGELIANCFGCGVGGAIDKLAAEYLSVDKVAARKALGINVSDILERNVRRNERVEEPSFIPESWLAPWKRAVHPYITRRGFSHEILIRAGVRFDSIKQRQVFPIRSFDSRLIGAAGRSVKEEEPRWYFYWGGQGKQQLYRLDSTYQVQKDLVVVEGPLDCLWLEQHGYKAVATMGSKFTRKQIEQIKEISNEEIYLAFDQDSSGKLGTQSLYHALKKSKKVMFVEWPQKDPVGLSKEELDKAIKAAKNYVQWRTLSKSS